MTAQTIEEITGLSGVRMEIDASGNCNIYANEPVPPAVTAWVRRCLAAGEVLPLVPLYRNAPTGWTFDLGTTDDDLEAWTRLLVLLREAEAIGAISGTTEIPIRDADGNLHMVTVAALRPALVEVGFAWQQAWASQG